MSDAEEKKEVTENIERKLAMNNSDSQQAQVGKEGIDAIEKQRTNASTGSFQPDNMDSIQISIPGEEAISRHNPLTEKSLAWNPSQAYRDARDNLMKKNIVRVTDMGSITHPYQGREALAVSKIPEIRWNEAYNLFPELHSSGMTNKSATELGKAIIRNELRHYDLCDQADDRFAHATGHPLPGRREGDATLGYSQLSQNSIIKRSTEFPQLAEYLTNRGYPPGSELKVLEDPQMAPVLVAANMAHNIRMYQRHSIPINERTLAYGFNPDQSNSDGVKILLPDEETLNKSQHLVNVLFQLDLLRKGY